MTRASYELRLESRGSGDRSTYRFETADGVASKRSFRDAELLLANALWDVELGICSVPKPTTASSARSSPRGPTRFA